MTKILKFFTLEIVLIIFLSIFVRTILLTKVPTGVSNDELDLIINAKSFFLTGKTLIPPKAELSHIIISPFIGLTALSLFNARFPFMMFNTALIIVLYLIIRDFIGKKGALFVAAVAIFNPWNVLFGRSAYEPPISTFFFFLALYLLLKLKRWRILLAFIPLSLAFYTYIGSKLIFLPFIVICSYFAWYFVNKKRYLLQYLILLLACLTIFVIFSLTFSKSQRSYRTSEIMPNLIQLNSSTQGERAHSLKNPFDYIFINKATVLGRLYIDKYLGSFSTKVFFSNGDDQRNFSFWTHGYFYYLDFLFLFVGLGYMFMKKRKLWLLCLSLAMISPIPVAISTIQASYSFRTTLLPQILIIFVGLGLFYTFEITKERHKVIFILVIILYFIQVLNFANIYFIKNPVYNSEAFDFTSRITSRYIRLSSEISNIRVISPEKEILFEDYIFYTNALNKNTAQNIYESFKKDDLKYKNIKFTKCPENLKIPETETAVISVQASRAFCDIGSESTFYIARLSDAEPLQLIYNDKLCGKYQIKTFFDKISISKLNIEKLDEKTFCEMFILKKMI